MDDEECLPENSNLRTHLQSLGYDELEVKKSPPNSGTIKLDYAAPKCTPYNEDLIDEEVIEQIKILVSTQMLFEEDVRNIENLLSNFKAKRCGMLKNMFQGMFVVVVFLGVILYCILGGYVFFIVSTFYAYRAADYLWKKNYSQRRLKKLASILQSNYALISKTIRFINENNKFIDSSDLDCVHVTPEFELYNNFKSDFYISLVEIISILSNSTKLLIAEMPLYDYVENPKYYICNNFNINCYDTLDLVKLYQIYLLVQSEFLQRCILSLIPNLNLLKRSNIMNLNKVVTESCVKLLKVKNNLNKKFKFVFFNGIYSSNSKTKLNLPCKPKVPNSCYKEELVSSIHDVSNTFQNLLIKSRNIEENLKSDKLSKELENDLMNIQAELSLCQRNLEDGFILLKKANGQKESNEPVEITQGADIHMNDEQEKVQVGYSDLNPTVEDEIFEAHFVAGDTTSDAPNFDDWDLEDKMKKKLQKEYSKKVMNELKTKLMEKAKNWEKREAEIMRRKNGGVVNDKVRSASLEKDDDKNSTDDLTATSDTNTDLSASLTNDNNDVNDHTKKLHTASHAAQQMQNSSVDNGKCTTSTHGIVARENNAKERKLVDRTVSDESFHQNHFGLLNKNFLTDIGLARQRILQTNTVQEQCYCDSGDETDPDQ
ncbi:hypothetical protein RUM43_000521 [Polyplax serrata]|uniref:Vezatin n=1 Tax=Polyplax serrata TaxID=468196 RepID=A0AAN8SE29_POLSC